jgi:hypothetical protein
MPHKRKEKYMKLEKIYEKVNNGLSITEAQLGRVLRNNKNLNAYVQKRYYNDDGTIDSVKYRLIPRVGSTTPCKDMVYVEV